MSTIANEKIDELINQINPDMVQCTKCNRWINKKILKSFYNMDKKWCPICLIEEEKRIEQENEKKALDLKRVMNTFYEKYENNPYFCYENH